VSDSKSVTRRRGPLAKARLRLRQIVAEMRKVVYPTRRQLLTYTAVVLFFVAVMIAIVSVLDWAFSTGMLAIFG